MNVILASASPRRSSLLKQVNLDFSVDASTINEDFDLDMEPSEIVQLLSKKKGEDVALRHKDSLIIAADTIVCQDGNVLGKPSNFQQAKAMLETLSNNTHEVYSGVYIAKTNSYTKITDDLSFFERTNVTFSALTEREIENYIKSGSPFDKAGGYGIQDDLGSLFVKKIEGDYYNVVGFPLNSFYQNLKLHMPLVHQQLFFDTA